MFVRASTGDIVGTADVPNTGHLFYKTSSGTEFILAYWKKKIRGEDFHEICVKLTSGQDPSELPNFRAEGWGR